MSQARSVECFPPPLESPEPFALARTVAPPPDYRRGIVLLSLQLRAYTAEELWHDTGIPVGPLTAMLGELVRELYVTVLPDGRFARPIFNRSSTPRRIAVSCPSV